MQLLYRQAIGSITASFRHLEDQVPKPRVLLFADGEALRYEEQTVHQAIILKLARYISGLNAIDLLLAGGFVQEQAVLQRTLDEIGEDITFLSLAISQGETGLHRRYLRAFWQEEFQEGVAPIDNTKGRYKPSRRDIRAATEKIFGARDLEVKAGAVISQTYSSYVHAAAPQVMEMCGGPELRFYVSGLRGTSRMQEHIEDAWNYIYRGLLAVTMTATVFGEERLVGELRGYMERFEAESGTSYMAQVQADIRVRGSSGASGS